MEPPGEKKKRLGQIPESLCMLQGYRDSLRGKMKHGSPSTPMENDFLKYISKNLIIPENILFPLELAGLPSLSHSPQLYLISLLHLEVDKEKIKHIHNN